MTVSKFLTSNDVLGLLNMTLKNYSNYDIIDAVIHLLSNLVGCGDKIAINIVNHNIMNNVMEINMKELERYCSSFETNVNANNANKIDNNSNNIDKVNAVNLQVNQVREIKTNFILTTSWFFTNLIKRNATKIFIDDDKVSELYS